jgi:two-component system response regulator HydG
MSTSAKSGFKVLAHEIGCNVPVTMKSKPDPVGLLWGIISSSPKMRGIFESIKRFAKWDAPVLITGETGTGKELVARALHQSSGRSGPFLAMNCCSLTETLAESEFFGHERSAFTGADRERAGWIEAADNGTLLLDEIGDLSANIQGKLLRFLQERTFQRVGSTENIRANARIIAATNTNLSEAVESGRFRRDLFFRLNVLTIEMPPLRDRIEDIPLLVEHLLKRYAERKYLPAPVVLQEAMEKLVGYHWPGNVRELENVLLRAWVNSRNESVKASDLDIGEEYGSEQDGSQQLTELLVRNIPYRKLKEQTVSRFDNEYLDLVLRCTKGNLSQSARIAQMDKKNLVRKLKSRDIDWHAYREESISASTVKRSPSIASG